jgi:transposase-like protein
MPKPYSQDLRDRMIDAVERGKMSRRAAARRYEISESNLWLDDVLRRALNPSLPQMQNTDGEPLEFITVHFQLVSKSNPPAIRASLDGLPPLRKERDAFWNWVEEKAVRWKSAKGQAGDTQTFGTTMDDGAIVLGTVELTTNAVTLSVNSEVRAARGRALLEPVLTGLVRAPLIERQIVEQMMASARGRSSAQDALRLPPDEERRIIHQGLTDHYRRTLDEPIPSLGNQSPRKAAKTAKGREKVVAWLKMLENHSAQQGRDDSVGGYDFTWIWKEFGLGDERR